jgi:hypothetical protein
LAEARFAQTQHGASDAERRVRRSYIIVYVIWWEEGYMKIVKPVGAVYASYQLELSRWPPSGEPYCNQSSLPAPQKQPCRLYDDIELLWPPAADRSLFISTRVSEATQAKASATAAWPPYSSNSSAHGPAFFATAPERGTVLIRHSFQAQPFSQLSDSVDYAASSKQLSGKLLDSDGNTLVKFPVSNQDDTLNVSLILRAANVDLDEIVNGSSWRYSGLVLLFQIFYSNVDSDTSTRTVYTYTVTQVKNIPYKGYENIYLNATSRLLRDRHGIKMVFVQDGSIGRFDFQTMLIQLVSALGLMSVATLVVDMLMLYLMPLRDFYNRYKYQVTEDFSDVRHRLDSSDHDGKVVPLLLPERGDELLT